ncbi:MAG: GTP-binding protein [Alphaproteobacteria bacterium]|nr:GTP-binding protein [Alphaproteobacteria bacterium]MCZ6587449.1 GTP-binding protein [Alphaproteobacteria bacterium]MCZ6589662.1 GTP-binding protein [Alphaproteobacteria bacterium]MCZ6839208.1 GTP-binding protein [Alphaproteobacteria bacterium]
MTTEKSKTDTGDRRAPLTLLTGFLGSGKTTMLNHILSSPDSGKTAVIVNEFGEIGIDGDLITRADDEMMELTNGCICCAMKGDLLTTLLRLVQRRGGIIEPKIEFDRVIVETTGIADPTPLAQLFYTDMTLSLTYRLDAVLTVIDLKHFQKMVETTDEARKQIAFADKLILNKRDLVSDEEYEAGIRVLDELNPLAPREIAEYGRISVDRLLDIDLFEPKLRDDVVPDWIGIDEDHDQDKPHSGHHHHHDNDHAEIVSVSIVEERPLHWEPFLAFLQGLVDTYGEDLFRVKAIAQIDAVDLPVIIQGVQEVFSPPTHIEVWPGGKRQTRLVIIGRRLRKAEIFAAFENSLERPTTTYDPRWGAI